MSDVKNELDAIMISILKGRGEAGSLNNDVMQKIAEVTAKQKARKAKENIVVFSYISFTLIVAAAMLFLSTEFQLNRPVLQNPSLGPGYLKVYYTLMATCSVLSVVAFAGYFIRSRRFV